MEEDWTEKYRPRSLKDVLGNNKATTTLYNWARAWEHGTPQKRAVILSGSPGIGKTSTALALARDMEWGVIELNASDVRNAENIRNIATRGALFETFTDTGEFISARDGGRKLIILDEADNLYERIKSSDKPSGKNGAEAKDYSDRGGKSAILQTIKQTHQPMILIVNDLYALTKNTTLKRICELIKFQKVRASTMEKALIRIIRSEGVEVEREALQHIVNRADGDMRAAINDLQALSLLEGRITEERAADMGFRDNRITIYDALSKIFKGEDTDVRKVAWDLDETPDTLLSWLDENLPHAYTDPLDIMNGYEALSRADVYLGRVRKRQYYRLWAYANDMMTAGVALARSREYRHYTRYQFPSWIMKMSRTKGMRKSRKELSGKIAKWCHTSIKDARMELLPVVQTLFRASEKDDFHFGIAMTEKLGLTNEDIAFLLGTVVEDERIAHIMDESIAWHGMRTGYYPSQMKTKKSTETGLEIKRLRTKKKKTEKKRQVEIEKGDQDGVGEIKDRGAEQELKTSSGDVGSKEAMVEKKDGGKAEEGKEETVEIEEKDRKAEEGSGEPDEVKEEVSKKKEPGPERPWF